MATASDTDWRPFATGSKAKESQRKRHCPPPIAFPTRWKQLCLVSGPSFAQHSPKLHTPSHRAVHARIRDLVLPTSFRPSPRSDSARVRRCEEELLTLVA